MCVRDLRFTPKFALDLREMLEGGGGAVHFAYTNKLYLQIAIAYIYAFIQFTKRWSQNTHWNMNTITRFWGRASNVALGGGGGGGQRGSVHGPKSGPKKPPPPKKTWPPLLRRKTPSKVDTKTAATRFPHPQMESSMATARPHKTAAFCCVSAFFFCFVLQDLRD